MKILVPPKKWETICFYFHCYGPDWARKNDSHFPIISIFQYLRYSINAAVYTLPKTTKFTNNIAPDLSPQSLVPMLTESADILDDIFRKTETLFTDNNLQNIP